jgi:GNAT superfamily N-acetyltransferase
VDDADRHRLAELAPVLRRASELDARSLVRIRIEGAAASVLVRLPFGVLVSRTVLAEQRDDALDVAVLAAAALAWLDGDTDEPPPARDELWRTGRPPSSGWRRIETVPDDVVRGLVRSGALAVKEAAQREGVPGAQPRAEVTDALLDSVVLTVSDDGGRSAEVTLRALSALTRMGFLPRGGATHVDQSGRWVRVVAQYGTVYLERPGGLVLR